MAKMKKSTVVVTDNSTGESVSYEATATPKRTTVGNCFFGTINYKGIAKIQEKWPQMTEEKMYNGLLMKLFQAHGVDLTADDIGDRGGSWNSPEARQRFSITVDDQPFNPPLGKQSTKTVTEEAIETIEITPVETPLVVEPVVEEIVVAPTIEAVPLKEPALADTTVDKNLDILVGAIKKGHKKEKLLPLLSAKRGVEYATALWNKAQELINPKPAEVEFVL